MTYFEMSMEDLHPSQLYVNAEKLQKVKRIIEEEGLDFIEPVPFRKFGDLLVLTDGHTRAVAMHQLGKTSIKVCWEELEMDWREYDICIQWCIDENITSIDKLERRIIPNDEYQILWLERCRKMKEDLE